MIRKFLHLVIEEYKSYMNLNKTEKFYSSYKNKLPLL